ncbi:MAG: hypothetical protein J0I06_12995 [Planctomycetes bacterium]|nr:hypothetical protein [Planctomycetota bacterium]
MRLMTLVVLGAAVAAAAAISLCQHLRPAGTGCPQRQRPTELVLPVSPEVTAIERRTLVKCQLARRAVTERTSLLAAAEWFEQVNGEDGMEALVRTIPGRSVREKLCRQVIVYVISAEDEMEREGALPTGPRASEELQAEFDRRLAAGEFPPEPGPQ